ncbi:MAG TPA: YeeE/YedE family protein [Acidobacteriota bacterium]|nr:YeeE/YedE family protein [Acidobacteriota bacterium]
MNKQWKTYVTLSVAGIVLFTATAVWTKILVLTAIPIGFLFGFFLQKGDLCGASAFSEVLVMRDRRKVAGLWVLITVAMLGFAVLDLLGWVVLNPKPFLYWNLLAGGILFGVGMVLAGGCVSGCLYKAATGNLNSIVALFMIPAGVMLVEFGPLKSLHQAMKGYVLNTATGEKLSLQSLTGIPFWIWALVIAIVTAVIGFKRLSRNGVGPERERVAGSAVKRFITHPWKPWHAGVAIGLLMVPAYLSSAASGRNYPLGVTHGVMQAELLLIDNNFNHVYQTPATAVSQAQGQSSTTPVPPAGKKVVWWLVLLIFSLMLGSWVSARLSGQAKLLPKPPDEVLFAALGGVLVGAGAALATGCVVGNIMSGWALLSIGALFFGVVVVLSNWAATYIYLMGRDLGT